MASDRGYYYFRVSTIHELPKERRCEPPLKNFVALARFPPFLRSTMKLARLPSLFQFLFLFLTLRTTTTASGKSEGISRSPHISRLRLCLPLGQKKRKEKGKTTFRENAGLFPFLAPSYGAPLTFTIFLPHGRRTGVLKQRLYFHSHRPCRRDNPRAYNAVHTISLHNDKLSRDLFPR